MSEFKTGQWAICDGAYMQIEQPAYRRGLMVCRIAGSDGRKCISIKRLTPSSLTPDFTNAKVGDECWLYGIGETGINSIGDNVTVWDDENKYVFDKSGYLYFIGEYIGDAYTQGVSCELEEFPMLFNSFAQFQAYWAERALEMGGEK